MSEVKERLVNTAADLMQRQGYCATGLNQIIQESATPKGSLYHYFPGGKEELAGAALRASGDQFALLVQQAIDEAGNAAQGMALFIRRYAQYFAKSEFEKGCPISTVALETAHVSEMLRVATRDTFHRWCLAIIAQLVHEGWHEKQARETAIFIMSTISGALVMSRAAQNIEPMEIAAKQIETLLRWAT